MIRMKKRKFILFIAGVVIASLLLGGGGLWIFAQANDLKLVSQSEYTQLKNMEKEFGKMYNLQKVVEEKYFGEIDKEAQMNAMYKALVDSLGDKYSAYLTAEEYTRWENYISGTFYGIGVTFVQQKNGDYLVTKVLDGSPADLAGVKKDDYLLKVDGKTYDDAEEMAAHMKGEEGTSVKITFRRGKSGAVKTKEMVRAQLEEPSVYSAVIEKKYGYIRISAIEKNTAEQFKTELADMENKNVKGLIIDLRNNPGGFVDKGIEIADMLLPEGTITYTEDNAGKKEYHNSDENCTKLKYVVLVNENTASSAEIIASAIKGNNGGKLVGQKTFGKGIIQGMIQFKDKSAVRLTIMQYFSPKGEPIHEKGVMPDYKVKLTKDGKTDLQMEKAIELLK